MCVRARFLCLIDRCFAQLKIRVVYEKVAADAVGVSASQPLHGGGAPSSTTAAPAVDGGDAGSAAGDPAPPATVTGGAGTGAGAGAGATISGYDSPSVLDAKPATDYDSPSVLDSSPATDYDSPEAVFATTPAAGSRLYANPGQLLPPAAPGRLVSGYDAPFGFVTGVAAATHGDEATVPTEEARGSTSGDAAASGGARLQEEEGAVPAATEDDTAGYLPYSDAARCFDNIVAAAAAGIASIDGTAAESPASPVPPPLPTVTAPGGDTAPTPQPPAPPVKRDAPTAAKQGRIRAPKGGFYWRPNEESSEAAMAAKAELRLQRDRAARCGYTIHPRLVHAAPVGGSGSTNAATSTSGSTPAAQVWQQVEVPKPVADVVAACVAWDRAARPTLNQMRALLWPLLPEELR